jgi:hypothetical protein
MRLWRHLWPGIVVTAFQKAGGTFVGGGHLMEQAPIYGMSTT